eukprot:12178653-Prorocentrum_lima.AAC.1
MTSSLVGSEMCIRDRRDARALMQLQDHLSNCAAQGNDAAQDAQCAALVQELESAKSMVASRDMLAAQWLSLIHI